MISIEEGVEYLETEFGMVMEKSGMGEGLYDCKVPLGFVDELKIRADAEELLEEHHMDDTWIEDEEAYLFYVKSDGLEELCSRLSKEMEA